MKECFGTIYPDLLNLQFGRDVNGKVFKTRINCMGAGHRDVHFSVDQAAWDECQRCELYRNCYDLSMGKFVTMIGLRTF